MTNTQNTILSIKRSSVLHKSFKGLSGQDILGKSRFSIRKGYLVVRPRLEFLAAIVGLVFLLPVFFVIGLLIKATSRGPVFYTQERVGKDGRIFNIIKFRSMSADAESKAGPVWAKKNDARITILGKIMRKTHVDELPQLINVVKGEMNIIGPRPERPFFVNKFEEEIPGYSQRLSVKPGIAGLAQCCHRYDETIRDVQKKLRYDILYIHKVCLMLDFKIVFLTLRVCLFGQLAR